MELDARKMQNPIEAARKKILEAAVKRELGLLQKKIIMATEIGTTQCTYTVHPSIQHPDTSQIIGNMIAELKKKSFKVEHLKAAKILVSWNMP